MTLRQRRGDRITCLECGAQMSSSRTCRRCGAPVPGPPQDGTPVSLPAAQEVAKSAIMGVLAWIGIGLLNLVALYFVVASVVAGIIEGSPAQSGANYVPPWACAVIGFTGAIVLACTVVVTVRRRRRRVSERRAMAPTSPGLLPESAETAVPDRTRHLGRASGQTMVSSAVPCQWPTSLAGRKNPV